MKRTLLALILATAACTPAARPAPTDDEVEARKRVLELAGAFQNDGFKLRDGNWSGAIKPGEAKIVQVNLYAGNDYWFSVAGTDKTKKLQITVYDETGAVAKLEPEPFENQENHTFAVLFSPTASGPYFVKVEELEGDPASFCLIYSYK